VNFLCPSCGTESVGKFCRSCGEQKLGTEDRSLRHYFDVVINYLTHFDSKGYRSLWLLVTRPGFLSVEQLRGSRVRYVKPLSLFLSVNVIYYLSIASFGGSTFTTPLETQLRLNDYYAGYARAQVEEKAQQESIGYAALEARFNGKAGVLSKTLIFLFIPIYALLFWALFFRSERKYLMEHVVVATHFWCFVLILLAVVVPAIAAPFYWWTHAPSFEAVFVAGEVPLTIALQLAIGLYLALMLRRVYSARLWYCVLVAAAIAWSFFHIVWLYRYFLFEITLRLI
jgi:hypothetical protein